MEIGLEWRNAQLYTSMFSSFMCIINISSTQFLPPLPFFLHLSLIAS